MPTTKYICNVCQREYGTAEQAKYCEAQPVINPHDIKQGDEIVLRNTLIPLVGLKAVVEYIHIELDHTMIVKASFDDVERNRFLTEHESRHRREEDFRPEQYVKFIDASMPEIAEKLGEAVHELWMAKRRTEKGWHSPEDCPNQSKLGQKMCIDCIHWDKLIEDVWKCDKGHPVAESFNCPDCWRLCPQCHTCMRPYKDLPDSEKELDHKNKTFSELMNEARNNLPLFRLYEACILYTPMWDVDNGQTLCLKCHKQTKTYAKGIKYL